MRTLACLVLLAGSVHAEKLFNGRNLEGRPFQELAAS